MERPADRFSALQRAENSSSSRVMTRAVIFALVSVLFSEPKIPQFQPVPRLADALGRFSALQRAENSSTGVVCGVMGLRVRFQCSSASRKFLNPRRPRHSSAAVCVSVLFSEPKIPQSSAGCSGQFWMVSFSALQRAENSSIRRTVASKR